MMQALRETEEAAEGGTGGAGDAPEAAETSSEENTSGHPSHRAFGARWSLASGHEGWWWTLSFPIADRSQTLQV